MKPPQQAIAWQLESGVSVPPPATTCNGWQRRARAYPCGHTLSGYFPPGVDAPLPEACPCRRLFEGGE